MITAIVGIVHDHQLLEYYLQHYRACGVERFVISCLPDECDASGAFKAMLEAQPDVEWMPLPRTFQRARLVGMVEEEIRASCGVTAGDWVIPADLDELNQYPGDLCGLVGELERDGYTHVEGELRDRLAPGGVLTALMPFDEGVSIWDQYPLEADVTGPITKGQTTKVLLSRGDLSLGIGHHSMRRSPVLRPFPRPGVAHHFKWRAGLDKTLAWRIRNEDRAKMPWKDESTRLQDYFQKHGRVVLDDVAAVVGWRPGTVQTELV